jgi:hypothetical protein
MWPSPNVEIETSSPGRSTGRGRKKNALMMGEGRGAAADADCQRQDRSRGEAWRPPERSQGVGEVLPQHACVLAGRRPEQIPNGLEPETSERDECAFAPRLLALRTEHLLYLPAVLDPEVEGKQTHQRANERAPAHGHTFSNRSFFALAISTIDSSRAISAAATRRPKGVNR